jgi:NitT/TauT family transport system permease protein
MNDASTTTQKPVAIVTWMGTALRSNTKLLSLVLFVLLWEGISLLSPSALLPGARQTLNAFFENITDGSLMPNLSITVRRVAFGFTLSIVIGSIIGIGMGLSKVLEDAVSYPVLILLSIPSLGYVILGLMWFGIDELALK